MAGFPVVLKDSIFQKQEGAKAELHGGVAAVENVLHSAFVCTVLEKMSISESRDKHSSTFSNQREFLKKGKKHTRMDFKI